MAENTSYPTLVSLLSGSSTTTLVTLTEPSLLQNTLTTTATTPASSTMVPLTSSRTPSLQVDGTRSRREPPKTSTTAARSLPTVTTRVSEDSADVSVEQWALSANLSAAVTSALRRHGFRFSRQLQCLTPGDLARLELSLADEVSLREALCNSAPSALPVPTQASINTLLEDLQRTSGDPPDHSAFLQRHDSNDARVFLVSGGGKSQAPHYDIVDFVPGVLCQRESLVVPGSEGKLLFEGGPKKPRLESITPHQFYAANSRILFKLIESGALTESGIIAYLGYTVKIAQLADRYVWSSVLLYDRQYRELQAELKFAWGSDCTHLHQIVLREKAPTTPAIKRPAQKTPIPLDPASHIEVCLNFNKGSCKIGPTCKFSHVCSLCFQNHPRVKHGSSA